MKTNRRGFVEALVGIAVVAPTVADIVLDVLEAPKLKGPFILKGLSDDNHGMLWGINEDVNTIYISQHIDPEKFDVINLTDKQREIIRLGPKGLSRG